MARLFQGGLLDTDLLSRPTVVSADRTESAMKYIGWWGARQVNVNTAPRQVLEAALSFGSIADAPKIASAIITQRRIKPFDSIDELKKIVYRYSDPIDKSRNFITTSSTAFTIRVTAVSGVAKVVAVAGVTIEGRQVKRIAVLSE
jgi:type II secretory pathway component PulK